MVYQTTIWPLWWTAIKFSMMATKYVWCLFKHQHHRYLCLWQTACAESSEAISERPTVYGFHMCAYLGCWKIPCSFFFPFTAFSCGTHRFFCNSVLVPFQEKSCEIIGVEIKDNAKPVHLHPFTCSTAFNHTQVLCYYFNLLEMYTDSFKVMESVCVWDNNY